VELDTLPGSGAAIYPGKLRTELLGGSGPDLFRIWGGQIAAPFVTSHQVIDLGHYYRRYGWAGKLSAPNVADMSFGGTKYGVPMFASAIGVWYRTDLFDKAGAAVPTTFDELESTNAALREAGILPFLAGGKYGWYVMRFFEYFLEVTAGPGLHDKLLAGRTSWKRPEVADAFGILKKWADKTWLPSGVLGLDPSQVEADLAASKGAMALDGQWVELTIDQQKVDHRLFGTFIPPTGHTPLRFSGFTEGFMITTASQNQDTAAKLIDFMLRPSSQQTLDNSYTTVTAVPKDTANFPLTSRWRDWLAQHPHYLIQDQAFPATLANTYFSIQSDVIQGHQSPKEAAASMDSAVKQWKHG
jgi:raffinose/stachyose/melibiose transport system substrate-binding protein